MKLYWKLFIALFAAVLVGAGALALLSQWRLDQGFVEYVNAADAELLPGLAQVAAQVHQDNGGWEALRDRPRLWFRQARMAIQLERGDAGAVGGGFPSRGERERPPRRRAQDGQFEQRRPGPLGHTRSEFPGAQQDRSQAPPPRRQQPPRRRGESDQGRPNQNLSGSLSTPDNNADPRSAQSERPGPPRRDRPPPRRDGPPPTRADRLPPPRRREGLHERIAIVDTQDATVVAHFAPLEGMPSAPILVDDVEVGRVVLQPVDRPGSVQDAAFLLAQRDWLVRAILIMLPIAALIAYLLARHLLAPVRAISAAARRLAGGDFEARVDETGSDELGRLSEDFNVLGRALAEHDGARRRWMADAAHELRTPLAVLQGEIEALQDGIRPTNDKAIKALHSQTLQLTTLVNDLQQLALADAGALDYRMEHLWIDECLLQAADAHVPRLSQAGIELAPIPTSTLKARVLGDAHRLRQLFDNLIENSLRYTRNPGQLQLRREVDEHYWIVHFDDSEPSVDAQLCEKLFEPFVRDPQRLRDVPSESSGGGLGLAICRRIALAHEAELTACPSPLGGLRVSLKIPLAKG